MPLLSKATKVTVEEVIGFKCDSCGTEYDSEVDIWEYQERHEISFTGGYGSVFGDGQRVEVVVCQHCLYNIIGEIACS